ncbi:unnamed protein product, partial [Mesorhabditis belari]|uniref:Transcription factor AP-2 C-terminal domain-containing protein n=1 Tax=Mesorhabditis belari TaxID=2138241 RepID=A0AAF3J780_9BILA
MQNAFLGFEGKNSRKRSTEGEKGAPLFNSTPNFSIAPPSTVSASNFFSPMPVHFPHPQMFFNDSFPFASPVIASNFSQMPNCSLNCSSDDSGIQSENSLLTETKIVFDFPTPNESLVVRDEKQFGEVSGRLCVLAQATKYKVTVGEIRRRINPPECLHASLINGILRKAKAKDGNKALRQDLTKVGLFLPSGRRKTTPATAFSALCEGEAVVLAQDFVKLCESDFPTNIMAQDYIAFSSSLPYGLVRARNDLEAALVFLSRMDQVISSLGVYPHEYSPSSTRNPYDFINSRVTDAVNNFSLLTHGFGHNAFSGVVKTLMRVAKEGIQQIDTIHHQSTNIPVFDDDFVVCDTLRETRKRPKA